MTENRIIEWLNTYESRNTRKVYLWALNAFFQADDEETLIERSEKYLDECLSGAKAQEDIEADFYTFVDRVMVREDGSERPPKSTWTMVGPVNVFLAEYRIVISPNFMRRLKKRKLKGNTQAIHEDRIPSNAELRRVISHMPPQGKALFRLLATSGSRIGAALALRVEDVVLEHKTLAPHVKKRAKTTKTGRKHTAFMTPEAKADIEKWLEVREDYLKTASGRSMWREHYGVSEKEWKGKPTKDDRLFPFAHTTAYAIWNNAVEKAGLLERDENTRRHTMHPHVLRKWFRTRLGAVLQLDVVEALMGHEGYLTREYRKYRIEELSEFYTKNQEVLLLEVDISVGKLNGKIKEQAEQLKVVTIQQATRIAELEQQMQQLEIELQTQKGTIIREILRDPSVLGKIADSVSKRLLTRQKHGQESQ